MPNFDYVPFPPPEKLPNAFTLATRQQCFDVDIINDNIPELDKQFTVDLRNLPTSNFPRVRVEPDEATILIMDNDSE